MARRYVGDVAIYIEYVGGDEYRGSVVVKGHKWRFDKLFAPKVGFSYAYDSPEAYDEMAQSAIGFGSYYTSDNRSPDGGEDEPDWIPTPEFADALSAGICSFGDGTYLVSRSKHGPFVNAYECLKCKMPESNTNYRRFRNLCENCFYEEKKAVDTSTGS